MKETMTIEELSDYIHESVDTGILTVSCDPIIGEMMQNNPLDKFADQKISLGEFKKVGLTLKSLSKKCDNIPFSKEESDIDKNHIQGD